MKVISIHGNEGTVKAGNLSRRANFSLLKGVKPGDYVLLHAGFAIEKVDAIEAKGMLKLIREV
ncbi:MAG: HypC/HybG/HupF family hydrogenase formation chaperone [Candidatus Omnitrophica bacterium]|nr:HypC/HybG/HupF family hydrogenase formation chaperone [Candidatus Omnitrophota bacterium]